MASEANPNPDLGRHTEPGHGHLTLQPTIHEDLATLAAYLGFNHVGDLKRCLFSPRVGISPLTGRSLSLASHAPASPNNSMQYPYLPASTHSMT
ncbi:hypothetical protein PG993_003067 [Apiospora rasikravindrae]|uniref:Uncharacterized protein n=1 Tax=Apiospora rasikravindrae TaxID=990691 RepID=A0ABR1TYW5_9PEZI